MTSSTYRHSKNVGAMIAWICSLILVGWLLGMITQSSIHTWYASLNRSLLTPPSPVFGITWTILYTMIAISGWLIWAPQPSSTLPSVKKLFVLQLFLNWCWTPLFFGYHLPGTALICLGLIVITVGTLIKKSYKDRTTATVLLIPYFLWLLFATYLNLYIWIHN